MSTFGWDKMIDWWDEKLGDEGDLWHRALIDPPLLRLVGEEFLASSEQGPWIAEIPLHCVMEAWKVRRGEQ